MSKKELKLKVIKFLLISTGLTALFTLNISTCLGQTNEEKFETAKKLFNEAYDLFEQQDLKSHQLAREKFLTAIPLFREVGDKKGEALSLLLVGRISDDLGDVRNSLDYYNQALPIFQSISDKYWEATLLNNIGLAYSVLNEYEKSLESLKKSLTIKQEIGDKSSEAVTLSNIGLVYSNLGDDKTALEYYERSLFLSREVGDKRGESASLNNIGLVYSNLGEKEKALQYYESALLISKEIEDKKGEALILNGIGLVYSDLGEKQKALNYYEKSLPIHRQVGNKRGESETLNIIGLIYSTLGDDWKALEYYEKSLTLQKQVGDKNTISSILNNIGFAYSNLNEKQKALIYYNQSLDLALKTGNKESEATILNNIGDIYSSLDEKPKALNYFNQSLKIGRSIRNNLIQASALNNIGKIYADLKNGKTAIQHFNQALLLSAQVSDKKGEAMTLNNLMFNWKILYNPKLAQFYGKRSINIHQRIRSNIRGLEKNTQQSYIKSVTYTYRQLTEIMISQNRLSEGLQVLNSFKDQQFFDFDQTQSKQRKAIMLTPREANFGQLYEKVNERVETLGGQIEKLKGKIGNRQPNAEETSQMQKLEADLKIASDEFLTVLKQAETEFSKPLDDKDKVGEVPDYTNMQTALCQLSLNTKQKTAAVYQLVGEENFHVLVITADDIKSVSTPYKNSDLNQKALDFWALLQSPVYNPNLIGKEIYDVVFKPLESVLPKDTKTIMWSLDGNLRYVPPAALWDGKQYLAERYNHVTFTRADAERLTRRVSPAWTGTGFGSSKEATVEVLGSRISFEALPGVSEELGTIFKKGVIEGATFPDKDFSKANFLAELKKKRPLVHIASHFSFRAGDEARSFLLLGDGTALTLEEMKREPNLFQGVELLTLSACNTAAQQTGANGREVDGFAELAQRLGAGAVMATLWSVADNSTPWLMREFYNLKLNKNKAESLREAQISLLKGMANLKPSATRTDLSPIKIVVVEKESDKKPDATRSGVYYVNKKDAPLWDKDKNPPFAHPFYWSPFILFGNWK